MSYNQKPEKDSWIKSRDHKEVVKLILSSVVVLAIIIGLLVSLVYNTIFVKVFFLLIIYCIFFFLSREAVAYLISRFRLWMINRK